MERKKLLSSISMGMAVAVCLLAVESAAGVIALEAREQISVRAYADGRVPKFEWWLDGPGFGPFQDSVQDSAVDLNGVPISAGASQTFDVTVDAAAGTISGTFQADAWSSVGPHASEWPLVYADSYMAVAFPSSDPVYLTVMQQYPGDANLDGAVDVVDLLTLVYAFGTSLTEQEVCGFEEPYPCHYWDLTADFNSDGLVDVADLLYLVDNVGYTPASGCHTAEGQGSIIRGQSSENDLAPTWYQALEETGMLGVYLDYIAEHPEAARTW